MSTGPVPVQGPRQAIGTRSFARLLRRWLRGWRRWSLWLLLGALVAGVLVTLVWLAGRYETGEVQQRLEHSAAEAVTDLRAVLARNLQDMQGLPTAKEHALAWQGGANELLSRRRELVRLELRDAQGQPLAHSLTPWHPLPDGADHRGLAHSETALACSNARRLMGPSYSSSYFQPLAGGAGAEMMEVCLPLIEGRRVHGYMVGTYLLQVLLSDIVAPQLTRTQEAAFTEPDGTRLASLSAQRRGSRLFTVQQLFDLPGNTLILRLSAWHAARDMLPSVLPALVTAISIALVSVLMVLVRDTRRRLRAERDLAEALAFRKAMEDSLVTGLRARDLHGRITYVNPAFCAMVEYDAAELTGQSWPLPYWPPEHAEDYAQRHKQRMTDRLAPPREGFESVFMRRDGTRFPVMIYEAPLIDAQGLQTGWMGCILDVSGQRRAEELSRTSYERLQATARLATVGEMASLLSHELNQPLAVISSYASGSLNLLATAQGAAPEPQDVADVRVAVQRIASQAERAGRIIKSVHDFVRRRAHAREAVPVQALFEAVLPLIRLQARKLDVQVLVQLEEGLPDALCDRTMVEQVLLNLARNAMQAMDEEDQGTGARRLELHARRAACSAEQGWLEFSVADNGVGIDDSVAERLFTPLFTTRAEGMGLGLSLCRTVVEQHGGHLGHSPREPRGTVFAFTLPAAASCPSP